MLELDRLRERPERLLPIKVGISISLATRGLIRGFTGSGSADGFVFRGVELAVFLDFTDFARTGARTSEGV